MSASLTAAVAVATEDLDAKVPDQALLGATTFLVLSAAKLMLMSMARQEGAR